MRFKTLRNFFLIPGGLLLTLALCGGLALLVSSTNCGGGDATRTSRQPERSAPQPVTTSAPATQQPRQSSSPEGRDEAIIAVLDARRNQSGDKIKDALPRESYKVNIYRDGTSPTWNRVKIDYDRDEKWDEKWDLEAGRPAKKHVSTADDDQTYDQEYRWQGGQWVPKK